MTLVNFDTSKIITCFSKNQEIKLQLTISTVFYVIKNPKYFILDGIFEKKDGSLAYMYKTLSL